MRVARKMFGEEKVSSGTLPRKASEDFAYYTKIKPGAYFFLTSAKGENSPLTHSCHFNFNDELIEPAAKFWWELAKDRLIPSNDVK
jgi:hippurate hydrolase